MVGGREVVAVEVRVKALEVEDVAVGEAVWDLAGGTNPVLARAATAFARSAVIVSLTRLANAVSTGPVQSAGQR